jgi:nicotinamidase-related amidase
MARLESERSALVVVDVQERFRDLIHEMPGVIAGCSRLIRFCARLGIPVLVTEQYPAGLGRTVAELAALLPEHTPLEKVTFSCCGDEGFAHAVRALGREQFLVCGIETHVCVYQTVRDLRAAGHQVAVAADAVSSRRVRDRDAGLALMRDLGAQLMTVEMILFEILVRAGTQEFKRVADILKE